MENRKLYSLDLLRGIAGYGVAITHYFYFVNNVKIFEYYSFIFVEIFFVLSGFVLSNQLVKIHNNKKNLKVFYYRRWLRTIPLYLVALIFYTAISNNFNFDFFKFLFFIQKMLPNFAVKDYFMVAWSLSIEEYFYLIFPIYLILLNKIKPYKLAVYFIIFLTASKILIHDNLSDDFLRTGTILRLDSIAFGFLLSFFYLKIINFKKSIVFVVLMLIFVFTTYQKSFFANSSIFTVYFIILSQLLSMFIVLLFYNLEALITSNFSK